MMTPKAKLHTYARRWCIERQAALRQEKDRPIEQGADDGISCRWTRIHLLEAILIAIERLVPEEFSSRQITEWRLVEVGQSTPLQSLHRFSSRQKEDVQAIQEERTLFTGAVRTFTAQKDWKKWSVEPLPYRRTLLEEESACLTAGLRETWGITKRWWLPFDHYSFPYEVLVFDSAAMKDSLTTEAMRKIMASHGVDRIYELVESKTSPDREVALTLWEPYKGFWTEKYWVTERRDWLFYTTHDGSTTIAGDWLLAEIKSIWPKWEEHFWVDHWKKVP